MFYRRVQLPVRILALRAGESGRLEDCIPQRWFVFRRRIFPHRRGREESRRRQPKVESKPVHHEFKFSSIICHYWRTAVVTSHRCIIGTEWRLPGQLRGVFDDLFLSTTCTSLQGRERVLRRAVYFVVFNIETFIHNVDSSFSLIDFWIHTIVVHSRDAPIFLIGTRGDLVNSTNHKDISSALELRYAKIIDENAIEKNEDFYFFFVDNTSVDVEKFKDVSARTEKRILNDKVQPAIKVAPSEQPIP